MGTLLKAFGRHSLEEIALRGDTAKLRKQLARGADVNRPASDPKLLGRAPLHAAALMGHVAMVEALINSGADVDARDRVGRTPLHYAVYGPSDAVVSTLLNCGADYTIRDTGAQLPIHGALRARREAARELIVARALEHSMEFAFFDGGHWCPYDEGAARLLGFELGEGVPFAALALAAGANYIVDFEQQIQLNVSSLFMKSVSWRILPNGRWNRPRNPTQGLHPGSQDPRLLAKYDSLLRSLSSQGVDVCPLYFQLHATVPGLGAPPGPPPRNPHAPNPQYGRPSQPGLPSPTSFAPGPSRPWDVATSDGSEPGTPLVRQARADLVEAGSPSTSQAARHELFGLPLAETLTLQPLRSGTDEFNDIAARFVAGMERARRPTGGGTVPQENEEEVPRAVTVCSVSRVRLPRDREEAFNRARAALRSRWGDENLRQGWHGAPKYAIDRILQSGFVLPPHGRNGRLYGDGVYLSPEDHAYTSAEYAVPDSAGTKHMLLCSVLLGSVEQVPFDSSQRRPSNVMRYDTGVDSLETPTRYIVWEEDMNDYILPTHILSFRFC